MSTLVAHGRKVIVGTTNGTVGIFDSESCALLNSFTWHSAKVRTLLVMPKEIEPCVCAEIPLPTREDQELSSLPSNHTSRYPRRNPVPTPQGALSVSFMSNPMFIPNPNPDSVMVTSIGNGRKRFIVNEPTKEERLKIFDNAVKNMSQRTTFSQPRSGEDVCLLTWRT